jgi:tRNA-specific 2-thiouridylase
LNSLIKIDNKKVVVALSGGVDSAVAAALLLQQGWEVLGVHLLLREKQAPPPSLESICQVLGIDCLTLDFRREFYTRIISYFASLYLAGKTPNPCVRCNEQIKFGALLEVIRSRGFTHLATGHYARLVVNGSGDTALLRGLDSRKDQSYFLHRLKLEALPAILFPLGRLTKGQVKETSLSLGLDPYLPARESQELCFITGNYVDFIHDLGGEGLNCPGPIINRAGELLGRHRGLEHYTVGQRQGLGVPGPAPYYVLEIVPDLNQVVVGCKEELQSEAIEVEDINWLVPPPTLPRRAEVRIRYRHPGVGCLISPSNSQKAMIFLDQPQTAITPGQAAVFYQGEQVLGGGWIVRAMTP